MPYYLAKAVGWSPSKFPAMLFLFLKTVCTTKGSISLFHEVRLLVSIFRNNCLAKREFSRFRPTIYPTNPSFQVFVHTTIDFLHSVELMLF
jgi:hypothetical protein